MSAAAPHQPAPEATRAPSPQGGSTSGQDSAWWLAAGTVLVLLGPVLFVGGLWLDLDPRGLSNEMTRGGLGAGMQLTGAVVAVAGVVVLPVGVWRLARTLDWSARALTYLGRRAEAPRQPVD